MPCLSYCVNVNLGWGTAILKFCHFVQLVKDLQLFHNADHVHTDEHYDVST